MQAPLHLQKPQFKSPAGRQPAGTSSKSTYSACRYTTPSSARRFKQLLTRADRVDIRLLEGGVGGMSDPCEARSHHGFFGIDEEVVRTVANWLGELPRP